MISATGTDTADLAQRLIRWQRRQGRHDLPWQGDPTPYRVWVSEIMLQQTQVATVIPYFQRFMERLPGLPDLAAADLDDVLALWSGLGYYSRARNLHRAAVACVEEHGGELPADPEALTRLPGIGRSTAGAIMALAHDEPHPILDGNAKRVLARFHAVEGWPGRAAVSRRLWELAERHTPRKNAAVYTQAIMDLGATVCTRTGPACGACPLEDKCLARRQGNPEAYPGKKPRRERPHRETVMLVLRDDSGRILLERRPPSGIWGGLWSLPETGPGSDPGEAAGEMGFRVNRPVRLGTVRHGFTHYTLDIHPWLADLRASTRILERPGLRWVAPGEALELGLPQPVRKLLEQSLDSPWQEPSTA